MTKQQSKQGTWTLLHSNAWPHTASLVQQSLTNRRTFETPILFPRYVFLGLFLFPKLKSALKGQSFSDILDNQCNVTSQLQAIHKDDYSWSFEDLYNCFQLCISANGITLLDNFLFLCKTTILI